MIIMTIMLRIITCAGLNLSFDLYSSKYLVIPAVLDGIDILSLAIYLIRNIKNKPKKKVGNLGI